MKKMVLYLTLAASLMGFAGSTGAQVSITGAGASFPFPLYSRWIYNYNQLTGVQINYQSIGSGGGIAQIKAKTVDFAGSDAVLTKEELDKDSLIQFPMIIGGIVPVINVRGIAKNSLRLTPEVLARIFLGEIRRWNDPAITSINRGLNLPNQQITVVHRADGSGSTFLFTDYLSKAVPAWREKVGSGTAVSWSTGVGGKGNEGVASYVQRIPGGIGYVEYAYALENDLISVQLRNRHGNFVAPTIAAFQAAAANADWVNTPGFAIVLTDQPGENSWPISGVSFILMQKDQSDAAKAKRVLDFFKWCFDHGGPTAESLHYVPLPQNVIKLVEDAWRSGIRSQGKQVW